MKRFRVGLVGLGWALVGGPADGADGDWYPVGRPAPPARVVPAGGEPGRLPADVRAGVPYRPEPDALWLPAARPVPAAGAQPAAFREVFTTPRVAVTAPAPQPDPALLPPARQLPPPRATQEPPIVGPDAQPRQMPRPVPPGDVTPVPRPPDMPPPDRPVLPPTRTAPPDRPVLPQPQPLPPAPELPPAPPALLVPAGAAAPGKHGTFGSPPLRLSRDYPSLAELHGGAPAEFPTLESFGRGYVQAEYLLWWMTGFDIPVLGTTSTTGREGYLNQPGTVPILGPGQIIGTARNGFRARAGWWPGDHPSCGIDGSFFFLGRKTTDAVVTSSEYPTITRPIFAPNVDPRTGQVVGDFGERVTIPGVLTGSLSADADSVLWGFDANFRKCLFRGCDARLTWFAGFRNVNLQESLQITENITVVGRGGTNALFSDPVGTVVVVQDSFATRNSFYGGQLGGTYERRWGRVLFDVRASVALGVTTQELEIDGYQVRTRPGMAPMRYRGGLLAVGPNLGTFTRNEFSVVPELTINLGYQITPGLRAYVGYNLMYWSNVIRPGDQIDPVVDVTYVPNATNINLLPSGLNRPRPLFAQSDLWLNGLQVGLEFRW